MSCLCSWESTGCDSTRSVWNILYHCNACYVCQNTTTTAIALHLNVTDFCEYFDTFRLNLEDKTRKLLSRAKAKAFSQSSNEMVIQRNLKQSKYIAAKDKTCAEFG